MKIEDARRSTFAEGYGGQGALTHLARVPSGFARFRSPQPLRYKGWALALLAVFWESLPSGGTGVAQGCRTESYCGGVMKT
jgi:hypothetical protein